MFPSTSGSRGGSGASSGGSGVDGSGTVEGGDGGDAGADLDGTIIAQHDGGASEHAPSPTVCNPSTCPNGCCLGDGTCFVATLDADGKFPTDIPCGGQGEACETCPSGYMCLGAECGLLVTDGQCSPDNCSGCCLSVAMSIPGGGIMGGGNTCYEGTGELYCGSGAGECQECAPSINGGHCVADPGGGGHCEGMGTCNGTNCAGCCAGNICAEGTQDIGCGIAGAPCQDCTMDGGLCTADLGAPDGGPFRACGYGCVMPTPPYRCSVFCTSTTDCFEPGAAP